MSEEDKEDEGGQRRRRFYDVEYHTERIRKLQQKPSTGLGMAARRLRNGVESTLGVLSIFMFLPIWLFVLLVIVVGYFYGPFAFLLIMGVAVGLLSVFVDKKVGRSLQFGESHIGRSVLAVVVAFVALAGVLYLFLYVGR